MSRVTVTWNGADLLRRVQNAEEPAVGRTLDRAVKVARASRRTKSRRGKLQIERFDLARSGAGVTGDFGYTEGYGLFHEIGFRGRAGDHVLRSAGDREFTSLAETLRAQAGL